MSLLPPNASSLSKILESSTARLGSADLSPVSGLWNPSPIWDLPHPSPDACPAELLPWLAWAEQVDEWSSSWDEPVQRAVIKAHRSVRRTRGTKQSVLNAVEALSGLAEIREWWEYTPKRTPHTFDIVIAGGDGYVEAELQESMLRAIDRNKPARSHYTLGVGLTAAAELNVIGLARAATYKRMEFQD